MTNTTDLTSRFSDLNSCWVVWKCGGSCLANANHLICLAKLILKEISQHTERKIRLSVVISAFQGVTHSLQLLCNAADQNMKFTGKLHSIIQRHQEISSTLLKENKIELSDFEHYSSVLHADQKHILGLLQSWFQSHSSHLSVAQEILGYGELWSSQLLFYLLKRTWNEFFSTDSSNYITDHLFSNIASVSYPHYSLSQASNSLMQWVDSRQLIVIHNIPQSSLSVSFIKSPNTFVHHEKTQSLTHKWLNEHSKTLLVILPGFICRTEAGDPWTLGPNSGDLSGALFARYFKATSFFIFKDVQAIYAANPKYFPNSLLLKALTYSEASALALYGLKALHSTAITYCSQDNIPIYVQQFNPYSIPHSIYTCISSNNISCIKTNHILRGKAFTLLPNIAVLHIHQLNFHDLNTMIPNIHVRLNTMLSFYPWLIFPLNENGSLDVALPQCDIPYFKHYVWKTLGLTSEETTQLVFSTTLNRSILCIAQKNICSNLENILFFKNLFEISNIKVRNVSLGSNSDALLFILEEQDSLNALRMSYDAVYVCPEN